MEQINPHDAYYARLKCDTAKGMKHLCGWNVEPESRTDVQECIAEALEDGTPIEVAEVLMLAAEWLHACHELKEHK